MRITATATLLLVLAACGADSSGGKTPNDTGNDVLFPDVTTTTSPDSSGTDASVEPDSSATTTSPDTTAEDTAVTTTDATVEDTSTPTDTTVTETSTPTDTTVTETSTPTDTTVTETSTPTDTTVTDGGSDTSNPNCYTLPAGHQRHLVLARPVSEPNGEQADRWQVLPLLANGTLGAPVDDFTMARAGYGKVSFTNDGALGAVAADDGKLNVFALDADGQATVIANGIETGLYPDSVHIVRDRLLIVDGNWQNNGGGIYSAPFACDGTLGEPELLYASKLAEELFIRADGVHVVAAKEAVDTTVGALHLVQQSGATWQRLSSARPFAEDFAILSAMAITNDGNFALVGDNQFFDPLPNRVGIVEVTPSKLTVVDVLTPIEDPFDIIVSPMNDAVIVVTGFANDIRVLDYDASQDEPFFDQGPPDYIVQKPQLPGDAVLVGGAHPNLVFIAENQAIRRFRFDGDGNVTDLGRTATGAEESYELIPGALGVQP